MPQPQTIPVAEHRDYALLWVLADEMAKSEGKAAEDCWLAIMDAFWVGWLPALFIFGHRQGGAPGRALTKLPPRPVLAALLLGPGQKLPAALRGWKVEDYQKLPSPFREYFTRDPTLGLALRRADFERWRARQSQREQEHAPVLQRSGPSEKKLKRRPGPAPGTVRRYEAADRKLFPKLEKIMKTQKKSRSAATLVLAKAGKIEGIGTLENRARRLAALYRRQKQTHSEA